jgi:hypothetical protein
VHNIEANRPRIIRVALGLRFDCGVSGAASVTGLAEGDGDTPVGADAFHDGDEEGASGFPYLALVHGSAHKAQGLEDDLT